jgi:hypothetical protein
VTLLGRFLSVKRQLAKVARQFVIEAQGGIPEIEI